MFDQLVPRLVADEHPVDLADVAIVLILGFCHIRDADRVPVAQQNLSDAGVVASGPIEAFAHRSSGTLSRASTAATAARRRRPGRRVRQI
jgi:hypothetical protein